jgi:hypothetical protein
LATGKGGDPLAAGKPFINNFLPNGGDMLRLNMAVPVPRNATIPLSAAKASLPLPFPVLPTLLTTRMLHCNSSPTWTVSPTDADLEDDVTRIELQAVGGVALAAIGLWFDDYNASNPATKAR